MKYLSILLDSITTEQITTTNLIMGILLTICGYFLNRVMKQLTEMQAITIDLKQDVALHKQSHEASLKLMNSEFSHQIERLSKSIDSLNERI